MNRTLPICLLLLLCVLIAAPAPATPAPRPLDGCAAHGAHGDSMLPGGPGLPDQEPPPPGEAPIPETKDGEEEEEDDWDVNNPPGPRTEVPIDVDEGTWMAVDVSP